jgi:hypothetical protein
MSLIIYGADTPGMNLNNPYIFHARFKGISGVLHGDLFSKVYPSMGKDIS